MKITRKSAISGLTRIKYINVDLVDVAKWQSGFSIYDAMPYLSDSDREFILVGVTQDEWDEAFRRGVSELVTA